MGTITSKDGTEIFYTYEGSGQPIVVAPEHDGRREPTPTCP
jgi:hypothetical protein